MRCLESSVLSACVEKRGREKRRRYTGETVRTRYDRKSKNRAKE